MSEHLNIPLEKIDEYRFRIPQSYLKGMRVPGIVYADEKLLKDIVKDKALEQVVNVAFLPGIVKASMAMPDIHWGYGFPIGGVAATDIENGGVISPGGVGYDINCGIRMLRTNLYFDEIREKVPELTARLFAGVPAGVGSEGQIRVSEKEEREILVKGARWAVEHGYGIEEDLECTEESGAIAGADPSAVSERAFKRGKSQSGTLGSGNHFLEVQVIDQLYDAKLCDAFGLDLGMITVMIHCGSRGLGHEVCSEYVQTFVPAMRSHNITVPDRELACCPVKSPEGTAYLGAMRCAANYAWNNRQCIMHLTRQVFEKVFSRPWQKMQMSLIYDVCHNIAKIETHQVDGRETKLCVHRKGATRAFGPGHPSLPERYKKTGQPVIIPGDMGRNSFLLVGTQGAMEETFGSTCHGAGRIKSRSAAIRSVNASELLRDLESRGISVQAAGMKTLAEEAPEAYKDVNDVVSVVHNAGISKRVCRMRPVGVIKG
jgi:tRNA-splicing ligase RtcB (3'-phosphate/5'-hydroxy nucleic acid ligase)